LQDPGEIGVAGMVVNLLDLDGNLISTTTTDEFGNYLFDRLGAGDYIVEVVPPTLWQITPMNIGNVDELDSDINPETRRSDPITLRLGESIEHIDIGVYLPATIGSTVWLDQPGGVPNVLDQLDTGLQGVIVNLWDMNLGTVVKTTTTNSAGQYLFQVPAGDYAVEFVTAGSYSLVVPDVGGDDSFDSDADPITRTSPTFNVTPGMVNLTIDAGYGITVPLEWLDFWGENRGHHNYLEWIVTNERNVSHYEIERIVNSGTDFIKIGEVQSGGDSYEMVSYEFYDEDLQEEGIYYYRIKQLDNNGFYSYTEIIAIDVEIDEEDKVTVFLYPNPIGLDGYLNINITAEAVQEVTGQIYDMKGSLITNLDDSNTNVGIKNLQIDMNNYPAGAYIVRVKIGEEAFVEKVTKTH